MYILDGDRRIPLQAQPAPASSPGPTALDQCFFGDCRASMRQLIASNVKVQTVVTSPPYFGLRSYDESALRIDPNLGEEKTAWLIAELERRGIRATRP